MKPAAIVIIDKEEGFLFFLGSGGEGGLMMDFEISLSLSLASTILLSLFEES